MRLRISVALPISFSLVLISLFSFPAPLAAQTKTAKAPAALSSSASSAAARAQADALLRRMTLDEKIAQLSQLPGFDIPEFKESVHKSAEDVLKQSGAGSMLWVSDPQEINRLQHVAVDQTRLHIPVLFALDVIHGYHTIFPAPLALASSWDTRLIEDVQTVAARETRAAGIQWTFAPMVDIARDARWGRMIEGAGEDPFLGAAVARAQVFGFQGRELTFSPDRVLACAKHFAGYGAAEGGRDYDSSYIPEEQMWNVYLPPFQAAAAAGAATFMSAYMDLNDVPASGNSWLLRDVLRQSWNFPGFVVSDANAVHSLIVHGYARDPRDAAFKAFTAGLNMDMASGTYLGFLAAEVQAGRISVRQIDDAVRPILEAKFRMGLFDHPYADLARLDSTLNAPEHQQLARLAVQRSVVLLRNENSLLPLDKSGKNIHSIAVIGPLGDATLDLLSMWGAMTKPGRTVSIFQGVQDKVGSAIQVAFAHGPNIRRDIPSFFEDIPIAVMKEQPEQSPQQAQRAFDDAVSLARQTDLAILALGEIDLMSAEAASRSSLKLSGRQQELLEAVVATGKPVVLLLINGRPPDISWAAEHVPAILEAWYPGSQGGHGIADILFGDANPSGHLPVSWPRNSGQEPLYYSHNLTQQPESAPDFRSRYWDLLSSPLYPFGFGLSYTSFSFDRLSVTPIARLGAPVNVSVEVANTGSRAADTVVQIYIHQRAGSASRPVRQLKGFERVSLDPGAKRTVHFVLGKNELQFWSPAKKSWVVEPEHFDVWAGQDSTAPLHAEFQLTQ